jgi:hypothetical protein
LPPHSRYRPDGVERRLLGEHELAAVGGREPHHVTAAGRDHVHLCLLVTGTVRGEGDLLAVRGPGGIADRLVGEKMAVR